MITPDGRTAYVVNQSRPQPPPWHSYEAEKRGQPQPPPDLRGTVTPIDTATNTPDGRTVYAANTKDADRGSGTVTPIDTATNTAWPPIPVGNGPWAIAVTPLTASAQPAD